MEVRRKPKDFYLRDAVPGLYFMADDPERYAIVVNVTGFCFFHEPGCEYDGWCVVPFRRGLEPRSICDVGRLSPWFPGSLTTNGYGQVIGNHLGACLSYDETKERFSRDIFAIRDEDVPITKEHKSCSDRKHFLFQPENPTQSLQS